jgi:tetratricopeptide (TPR) repeat protein
MSETIKILITTEVQKKACIFLIMLAMLLPTVTLYGHDDGDRTSGKPEKPGPSLDAARAYIISEDFSKAVSAYAVLLKKDSASVSLNAEYAYALALNGIYDAALARLDRVWTPNSGSTDVNFFTSQVFALMGYDMLAVEFGKKLAAGSTPVWISSAAPGFLQDYSDRIPGDNISEDGDVVADFKRANRLTAQNYNLMSIAMFEGIITGYPGEYLPYVGSSIALEKAGMYEKSAQATEQAIAIIGDNTEQQEARQMLEARLTDLRGKSSTEGKNSSNNLIATAKPDARGRRMLAYAGGMFSPSYLSLTGRFGTFISKAGSLSADLGVTSSGGSASLNLGVMNFFRQKIFAGGYGLGVGFGGGSTTFNIKLSVGFSIMNKDKSSSWDIFFDGQQPLAPEGSATVVGMSIGRSMYFGSR